MGVSVYLPVRLRTVCRMCVVLLCFSIAGQANARPASKLNVFWADREAASQLHLDHSIWQKLLDDYLIVDHPSGINRFDYDRVSDADKRRLGSYITYIAQFDPRQLAPDEQKAMWLNLFNALVVGLVLKEPSTDSITSIRGTGGREGPWDQTLIRIAMQEISLNTIEHNILRPIWNDPRIHFGLNYASIGSANLMPQVFTYTNIDSLLDQATRDFLASPRGVSFDGNRLFLSTIFNWYRRDFGGELNGIKSFIKKYVPTEKARRVDQSQSVRYRYRWPLNKP